MALPLDGASLVTLAACRSAGGVLAHGEGITGLTQAFLHAGATSVLAAQADVPDRLARRLMLEMKLRCWFWLECLAISLTLDRRTAF